MIETAYNLAGDICTALNTYFALPATVTFMDLGTVATRVEPLYVSNEDPPLQSIATEMTSRGTDFAFRLLVPNIDATDENFRNFDGAWQSGVGVLLAYGKDPIGTIRAFHNLIATVNKNDKNLLADNPENPFERTGYRFYKFYPDSFPKAAALAKPEDGSIQEQPQGTTLYVCGSLLEISVQTADFLE